MSKQSAIPVDDVEVEVVIEVGAEGGSIAVLRRAGNPPSFAMRSVDQSLLMIDEGPEVRTQTAWSDWDSAIRALERYPWRQLFPLVVHEDLAEDVWDLVVARLTEVDERRLGRWAEACGRAAPIQPA